jgi:hypothetical protein
MNSRLSSVSGAALIALAIAATGAQSQVDRPATKARMHAIFNSLSTALNLSLYETPFEGSENREMIMEALGVLAENAAVLETHGDELNEGFDYLRRSLARDANEAVLRYRQEQYEGAWFVLDQLTENCVACHSKLPGKADFDLGGEFVKRARVADLPPQRHVRLLVATRQFESALDLYEECFEDKENRPHNIAISGMLADYLKIALRVVGDYKRPRRTLKTFGKRKDVTGYLQSQIAEWARVIEEFDAKNVSGAEMATARRLVHEARQRNVFPADRHGLAHFIVASGLLQRYLESRPDNAGDITEAYYLLGVCESHTTHSLWVSETEFYLESAVRNLPASPYARLALEFLDGYVTKEYTGSSGVVVPDEVLDRLDELRQLVDEAP